MAISQAMTSSFRGQILLAVHDFRPTADSGASTFKLALYSSSATLDANTTTYSSSNEITGTNYTAGGVSLTNLGVTITNTNSTAGTGWLDFSDATIANTTITARGALIYNSTPKANSNANTTITNASVCVLDFGSDKTSTDGNFTIVFPAATNTTAILRIA